MTTKNTIKQIYRPCVGIALFNEYGKVFVGQRIDTPGAWQMPQGGIDPDEDIKQAALREMKEEIGTDKAEIIRVASQKICYDLPKEIALKIWDGRYKGQEQTWVALRFTGKDGDIKLDSFKHPEFEVWRWISLKQTIDLIVPFKRDTYKQVADMFDDLAK